MMRDMSCKLSYTALSGRHFERDGFAKVQWGLHERNLYLPRLAHNGLYLMIGRIHDEMYGAHGLMQQASGFDSRGWRVSVKSVGRLGC